MLEKVFLNRLRRELPRWVEQGWVAPEHRQAILEDIAARTGGVRHTPLVFGVLGVLLFGAGVISFFASNWAFIPKLVKLAVLFGAMWAAFAGTGWLLTVKQQTERGLAHALLLLGVILYGANIMLIAQIYHIQSHFPNGVLLWALGALAVTYLVPSQVIAAFGIALSALWAGMDLFGDLAGGLPTPIPYAEVVYWPFLIVLMAFVPSILQHSWRYAAWLAVLGLIVWGAVSLILLGEEQFTSPVYVLQVGLLLSLAVFLLGVALERLVRFELLAFPLRRLGMLAGLLSFYGLTLRYAHGIGDRIAPDAASMEWAVGTFAAALLVAAMFALQQLLTPKSERKSYSVWGYVLLLLIVITILDNLFTPAAFGAATIIYLAFNLLFLGAVVWLIYTGYHSADRFRVNSGFLFFAAALLTIYFDNFWALLDRSFFFMGAGVLLIGGGFLLERQRRRLVRTMAPQHDQPTGGGVA